MKKTSEGSTYYLAALALVFAGDLQMAEAALTAALHDAQSRGSVLGFATASRLRSMAILKRGRLSELLALDARCALAAALAAQHRGAGTAHTVLARTAMRSAATSRQPSGTSTWPRQHRRTATGRSCRSCPCAGPWRCTPAMPSWRSGSSWTAEIIPTEPGSSTRRSPVARDARSGHGGARDSTYAEQLIESELSLANEFGEAAAVGRALRALGSVRTRERGLEAHEAAVVTLQDSHAALDRAGALVDFGAALRRSGRRRDAREPLEGSRARGTL